ncbi:unnamed protein product [Rangifer tarandus platyrhynchus]|uniref:Uncharacterized protein n=1 Tax=Rangifer tarandus platyrhynchus TaxID=3082113 RepID=A0ABN8YXG9_RANTA|nr:unnamed protein product [Rangifer tarandus platyrhynchus]
MEARGDSPGAGDRAPSPHCPPPGAGRGAPGRAVGREAGRRGGGPGVPAAAEVRGKREGPHLRNPPPAAAAAASLRPGDLGARGRLARHTQTPASGGASSSEELG